VPEKTEKFEAWGLLELFGHNRLAGQLSEHTIGGCHFIRIDVPEIDGVQGYTRFFTNGAIYGMTITTEEVARSIATHLRARPVQAYEMPRLTQAAVPDRRSDFSADDDDDSFPV
jgi:hypothetical protein